jgi:hypothetical protein
MFDTDEPVLWYGLNRLMANYCADVDHEGANKQAHEFYLPDALCAVKEGPPKDEPIFPRFSFRSAGRLGL